MVSKTKLQFFLVCILALSFLFLLPTKSYARTDYYQNYIVDYYIEEDSSVRVEEKMDIYYDGEYRGTHRSIDLVDAEALAKCKDSVVLQCGGFDFLTIDEVWDEENGILKEGSDYELLLNEFSDGSTEVDIRYEFSSEGREFNSEIFTWGIKYTAYGSIGYFDDYDLFYWDTVFAERTVDINNTTINIHFPEDFEFDADKQLTVFNDSQYVWKNGVLTITPDAVLLPYDPNTILVEFPKGIVDQPAQVEIKPKLFEREFPGLSSLLTYKFRGHDIVGSDGVFRGIPTGKQEIEVTSLFFQNQKVEFDLSSNEVVSQDINLTPSALAIFAFVILIICNGFGLFMLAVGLIYPFYRWYSKGRDIGGKKTIVPWFEPPDEISPSLLGTLKDERVDVVDITSTIINLAFKGYLKIIEIDKGKEFEFEKLKDFDDLDEEEKSIITKIFNGSDKTSTTDLKNTFYTKIPAINEVLYKKLVEKGYFEKRPDEIRSLNFGCGIAIMIITVVLGSIILSMSFGIAFLFVFLPLLGFFILGLGLIVFAYFMPAKTARGTLTLERVKGFRMYLHTAERFRMQNLTPEMFEKYLSYAIVFGIEEEWAEKFKDIYKGKPDWYEGSDPSTSWSPYLLSRSLGTMSTVTSNAVVSKPASSGSSFSGGGWSGGGGSSGGFSGGGGGGGGGGSW